MRKIIWMAAFIIMPIWYASAPAQVTNIFSDRRALRVDDMLTVQVAESANAASQSATNTEKDNSFNLNAQGGSGLLGILPKFGGSTSTTAAYDGSGSTTRQGLLNAMITARVVKVLDNGNLQIEGSKTVEVNEEKELIKISGLVRPLDIGPNNVVNSASIADAQITYSGKGAATTAQRPGLLARAINWLF